MDERVTDRVLYDILIQAGRVVDLHIPRDRETDRPKGFAFAEYESKEIADYAVKLFTGLVTLYNRTLRFGVILFSLKLLYFHTVCILLPRGGKMGGLHNRSKLVITYYSMLVKLICHFIFSKFCEFYIH